MSEYKSLTFSTTLQCIVGLSTSFLNGVPYISASTWWIFLKIIQVARQFNQRAAYLIFKKINWVEAEYKVPRFAGC